jgi:hypothetical protein
MAKQKLELTETEAVSGTESKAKIAFDEYKSRMDAFYEKELKMKHHVPPMPPPMFGPPPPAYTFPPYEPYYYSKPEEEKEKTEPEPECKLKQLPILDSLTKLIELSFKAVNLSLTSGVTVLNRLSGLEDEECFEEYDWGGCNNKGKFDYDEDCHAHHYHDMCNRCHASVNNCCK